MIGGAIAQGCRPSAVVRASVSASAIGVGVGVGDGVGVGVGVWADVTVADTCSDQGLVSLDPLTARIK